MHATGEIGSSAHAEIDPHLINDPVVANWLLRPRGL